MADNDNNLVFTVSSDMSAAQRGVDKFIGNIGTASDQVSRKFEALGRSIDRNVTTALQQRINAVTGIGTKAANDWTGALADQGKELDRLRAKYNPLFTTINNYKAAQAEIRTLYRSGAIGVDEYTDALSRQRKAALANISAIKNVPQPQNPSGGRANPFQTANIAAQFQDVGVTAAMGMNPLQIALQQGTQLSSVLEQLKNGGQSTSGALLSAFGSLFSMTSLLTIGFVAVGAAAIQAVMKALPQVKSLDDAMKDHESSLKRVAASYGGVAEAAAKAGRENKRLVDAVAHRDDVALRLSATAEGNSYFASKNVGRVVTGGRFGDRGASFHAVVPQFQQDLAKLRADFKAGKPDFDGFYEAIAQKVELDPSLAEAGVKVIAESENFKAASDAMKEYQRVRQALFNDQGPGGRLLSQGTTNTADMGNLALYQSQQAVAAKRSTQAFYARLASEGARTTQERVRAARAEAAAQYNQDESQPERRRRIDQAGTTALIAANRELYEAARERKLALDAVNLSQQQEIGLVGKTGAAAESLRREYQLTADLRAEAAKRGITDEKEFLTVYADQIALIKKNAEEYGRLAEARSRAQLSSDLAFSRDQFNRTPEQRSIAEQLKSAGLPIDLTSKSAKEIADANARDTKRAQDLAQKSFDAQVEGIKARSPAQRIAAARAAAEAQFDPNEPTPLRQQRINNAEMLARVQIAKELADADRERSLNLRKLLEDQQQDIAMIGKTGGAAAAAAQQYQLMAQLRADAVKQGITDEAEFQKTFGAQIELIKQASASYGRLVDERSKAQLGYDLAQRDRTAVLPSRDRQIVEMQRQYGLPEDANSDTGRAIGKSIDAQANRDAVTGFLTEFKDGLVKNSESIGEAFGNALKNALMKQADKLWDNLFNQIAGALFPGASTQAATQTSVAGSGIVGLGGATVGRLISPTSIASQAMPALSSAGTTKTGIDLARIATTSGLGADVNAKYAKQFQGFVTDLESTGYKIKSIGGYNYRNIAGTNKLSNHAFGDAIDINPQQNPMGKSLVTDLPANVGEMAAKYGLSWGGAWNSKKDAMHFEVPASSAALDKLAASAGNATKGLGTFGTGIGNLGQQLTSGAGAFPAAPAASGGGGGILGWIGGIFGGGRGTQWNLAAAGKLKPGLWADGGYTGPGGKNTPAGIVHAGEVVWSQRDVAKAGGVGVVEAMRLGRRGYANGGIVAPTLVSAPRAPALMARRGQAANNNQPGVLQVHITGASGDDHVRAIVKQGVGEGLSQYNDQQRRGGFGTLQSRYNNQKG